MTPEMFRKLAALGLSHEQMAGVLEVFEDHSKQVSEAEEERKAKARARVQKWRERQAVTTCNVTERHVTLRNDSRGRDARGLDNLLTKKITGKKEKEDNATATRGDLADFRAELSSILDPDRVESLVAVRRKKGATMTANTGRLLVAAIRRCQLPPAEVADEMALRNWTSVKPDWLESRSAQRQQSRTPPRKPNAFDALEEISRMKGWTDEPASVSGNHEDAERISAVDGRHSGIVVDLRRGADWSR